MLIGGTSERPSLEAVRAIKQALSNALELPEGSMVTVTQLACLEDDCAPLETVIGLLHPDAPQQQHKIHKATDTIDAEDLKQVCEAWGYPTADITLEPLTKET